MNIIKFWNKRSPIEIGVIAGVKQALYIYLVALFFQTVQGWDRQPSEVQGMILGLTLFVLSAAISGAIVFGFPLYFALQKEYAKAIKTVSATISTLLVIFVIMLLVI